MVDDSPLIIEDGIVAEADIGDDGPDVAEGIRKEPSVIPGSASLTDSATLFAFSTQ